jgi:pilus assembly protein Flp/PilA
MRRRELIKLIRTIALAWPLAACGRAPNRSRGHPARLRRHRQLPVFLPFQFFDHTGPALKKSKKCWPVVRSPGSHKQKKADAQTQWLLNTKDGINQAPSPNDNFNKSVMCNAAFRCNSDVRPRVQIEQRIVGAIHMDNLVTPFIRDEFGATAIEYGPDCGRYFDCIIAAFASIGSSLNTNFTRVQTALK